MNLFLSVCLARGSVRLCVMSNEQSFLRNSPHTDALGALIHDSRVHTAAKYSPHSCLERFSVFSAHTVWFLKVITEFTLNMSSVNKAFRAF